MDRMTARNHLRDDVQRAALANDVRSRVLLLSKRKSAPPPRFRQSLPNDVRRRVRMLSAPSSASDPRPRQSLWNDARSHMRVLSTRIIASGLERLQGAWNDAHSGMRVLSTRISASGLQLLQGAWNDVRSGMRVLSRIGDSGLQRLQGAWDDVRSGMRVLSTRISDSGLKLLQSPWNDVGIRTLIPSKRKSAAAILSAVGVVALFALASDYGGYRGEHKTAVPACDNDLCSSPEITAIVPDAKLQETAKTRPAKKADEHRQAVADPKGKMAGIVTSHKTGARARVGAAYAARFQAYIDDLETNHGARILFMGGIRPGRCSLAGLHPCGKALDVCQVRRGVVDARCHLPPRQELGQIAASHGLFEGGRWCDSDYGHAQLVMTRDCSERRTPVVRRQKAPEIDRQAAVDQRFRPM